MSNCRVLTKNKRIKINVFLQIKTVGYTKRYLIGSEIVIIFISNT